MVDVLVLGATGYTGKLITRYLAVHRERDSFTLGLAARSKSKLSQLVSELDIPSVKTFIIDVTDEDALTSLLQESKARVVLSTVGPFYTWGRPVIRACARLGIHYVDITGETPFVRDVILELDFLATKTHAILVPSCGFDSLPSDALAFLSARTLRDALSSTSGNVGIAESHTMFTVKAGGASGGTLATAFSLMDTLPRSELIRMQAPDVLSPIKAKTRPAPQLVFTFPGGRPAGFGHLFPLAPHNVATVQRTRGLLQLQAAKNNGAAEDGDEAPLPYSDDYTYSESLAASSRISAFIFGLGIALSSACIIFFPSLRWLLKKFLPAPGQGPSDKALEKGSIKGRNISVSSPIPGSKKPIFVESILRGRGDPGYALTAVMISETALALLAPREKLSSLARSGGVLTPMSALGTTLIRRLSASGRFEFESHVLDEGDK